ncbi:MAG: hypothetical protein WBJ10_12535 [Daejeonella sp.]|uniref:hypothetical protein n=1 Tax=Daejeonella sp. TaxID=2805397 RepID=UPI003C770986
MKIPQLIYAVIDKVSPMPPADKAQLEKDSDVWFNEQRKLIEDKKAQQLELNLMQKAIDYSEAWWFRTLVALAYIPLIVWIQNIMNPVPYDEQIDLPDNDRR